MEKAKKRDEREEMGSKKRGERGTQKERQREVSLYISLLLLPSRLWSLKGRNR